MGRVSKHQATQLRPPCAVEVICGHDGFCGRLYFGRLLQICHGYGQVQFPYSVSEDDPTPMREWVPVAGTQQDEAALLNQGVRPDSIRGYVEPQEDLLKAPWERSMVLRPHCTNPNLRMRVHHKQWQQLAVGALVEVQLKTEPNELVFGCVDLVNGVLGVERDHPLQGEDQFLHFDQLEQVYEGQPRWDPSTGKWLAEWALVAEVQAGEVLQQGVQLPPYVQLHKELFVKAHASEHHYHRALLRHAASDNSALDIRIIQGAPDGVHDRVEIIDATSSRIWRGGVEELLEVAPGRWRPTPPNGLQQDKLKQAAGGAGKDTADNGQQQRTQTAAAEQEEVQAQGKDEQQPGAHMQLRVRCKTAAHGSALYTKRGPGRPRKQPCPQPTKVAAAAAKPAAAAAAAAPMAAAACKAAAGQQPQQRQPPAKKPKLNSSHEESAEQQTLSRQQVPPPCPSTASPQSARLPTAAQAFVIPTGVQQPSNKAAAAAPVAMGVMPVAGSSSVTPLPCMPAPAALQSAMLDMWRFGARMGASPYAPGFLSMALAAPWAAGLRPASVPADTVPASPAGAGGSGSMQAASQMLPFQPPPGLQAAGMDGAAAAGDGLRMRALPSAAAAAAAGVGPTQPSQAVATAGDMCGGAAVEGVLSLPAQEGQVRLQLPKQEQGAQGQHQEQAVASLQQSQQQTSNQVVEQQPGEAMGPGGDALQQQTAQQAGQPPVQPEVKPPVLPPADNFSRQYSHMRNWLGAVEACGQLSTKQAQEVRLLLVELDGDAAAMAAFEDRTYPLLVMAARSGHEGPQQVVELVQALRAKLKRQHGGQ